MSALSKQIEHLKKDKTLSKVILGTRIKRKRKDNDLYLSLMRAVVGQQLSVKAAQTIWTRFLELFPDRYPLADKVLAMSDETLRSAGLSYQKASYVKNIAGFSVENTLDYHVLRNKGDEELINYLVTIKGVGRWTVEMILMFNLQREDVFPKDDLGIQNALKMLYKCDFKDKKTMLRQMERISQHWRPYRTLACFYLWKYKDAMKG